MKRKTSLLMSIAVGAAIASAANPVEINLSKDWKVQSSAKVTSTGTPIPNPDQWYNATVPSTVMGVLTANGVYSDNILDDMNYKTIDHSQFDKPWWWQTSFTLPELTADNHVSLDIDGISYRAEIWLNGHKIADADTLMGTFRRHSVDITPFVKKHNDIAFKVYRAQPGEPNIGFVDWNPRPADESMGIFRPVFVRVTDKVDMKDPVVKSRVNTETLDEAWLTLETTLVNNSGKTVKGKLTAEYDGKKFSKKVTIAPHASQLVSFSADDTPELYIKNPRLWWCNNMGNPEMYHMDLSFETDGRVSDTASVNFGIRDIKDYFTADGHRGFLLNGKPVLVRSAGWTDDIFLRNDSARNEIEVQYVKDMNLNSIRFENIWGTSENVYDLCDRNGLLVLTGWSCHWEWDTYLGSPCDDFGGIKTEADMDLIAHSLGDQVTWLRNHPSIIAWFVGSDMIPRPELEQRYRKVLANLDDRPYITAAKAMTSEISGPSGTKMAGPYEYVGPNYWYQPEAPGGAFGWNTETGIGAQLPQKESIKRMIPADKLWPINETWNYHCTASTSAMNSLDTLTSTINHRLGEAADLDDYIRKAEWINYDGTRTMFEAFRVRIPEATGIVQWMLNSAWPSLYWQVYDHYLAPTSAYYSLRHSNEPVQLIYDYGKKAVFAVNESNNRAAFTASIKRFDLDATKTTDALIDVTVEPYTVVKVCDIATRPDLEFMFLSLNDKENTVARNMYVLAPTEDIHDWSKNDWVGTPLHRHADFTRLNDLAKASVKTSLQRDGNNVKVTLTNSDNTIAFFNRLAALDAEGHLITPAFWSDNYVTLQPGETIELTCRLPEGTAGNATFTIDGWNIDPATL